MSSTTLGSNQNYLFKGDQIPEFLLTNAMNDTSQFGVKLYNSLTKRVVQHRNVKIVGLIRYLSNNQKPEIAKTACYIYVRLFNDEGEQVDGAASLPQISNNENISDTICLINLSCS